MTTAIKITMHAFDRASQRLLPDWLQACPDRKPGLGSWLMEQLRPHVDVLERAGELGKVSRITVRGVAFEVAYEPPREAGWHGRVVVKTVLDHEQARCSSTKSHVSNQLDSYRGYRLRKRGPLGPKGGETGGEGGDADEGGSGWDPSMRRGDL